MPPTIRIWLAHQTLSNFVVAFTIYFCVAYGCGFLMARRGRSCVLGFSLAFFLGIIGVIIVAYYPPASKRWRTRSSSEYSPGADARAHPTQGGAISAASGMRTCSFCRLAVPTDAIVCRVCQTVIGHSGAAEAVA
jgi:hypothetical protein